MIDFDGLLELLAIVFIGHGDFRGKAFGHARAVIIHNETIKGDVKWQVLHQHMIGIGVECDIIHRLPFGNADVATVTQGVGF